MLSWTRRLFLRRLRNRPLSRANIFLRLFDVAHRAQLDGNFAEFGCFEGTSSQRALEAFYYRGGNPTGADPTEFHFFDSFEGLPALSEEDRYENVSDFEQGQYSASESAFRARIEPFASNAAQIKVHRGFYHASLPALGTDVAQDLTLVHIDVDLQSSCDDVLAFLTDRIRPGCLIAFDDYYCYRGHPEYGVQKSLAKWLTREGFVATEYCNYDWAGKVFFVNR